MDFLKIFDGFLIGTLAPSMGGQGPTLGIACEAGKSRILRLFKLIFQVPNNYFFNCFPWGPFLTVFTSTNGT